MPNIAVLAPIPRAIVEIASTANAGLRAMPLIANRKSEPYRKFCSKFAAKAYPFEIAGERRSAGQITGVRFRDASVRGGDKPFFERGTR